MSSDDENVPGPVKKVGYRSPPLERQFKPGESGNPLGRPRKSKTPTASSSVDRAYLAEAKRIVRVKDDDGVHELPVIHVAARAQAMAAAKGDHKAQKDFAANTRLAERAEQLRNEKLFEASIEYKAVYEHACDRHDRNRLPSPKFGLNPDHLITDANTRTVRLSVAASTLAAATSRESEDMRRELVLEHQILTSLLTDQAENVIVRRELSFVGSLLKRLDPLT